MRLRPFAFGLLTAVALAGAAQADSPTPTKWELFDIRLQDHLVLGDPALDPLGLGYYSFRRGGLL